MSDTSELGVVKLLAQLGGGGAVIALALLVWRALRDQSPLLKETKECLVEVRTVQARIAEELPRISAVLTSVQVTQAQLLERERTRNERIEAARAAAASRASGVPHPTWDDETRPITAPRRARTDPYGQPTAPYGPMKPPRDED